MTSDLVCKEGSSRWLSSQATMYLTVLVLNNYDVIKTIISASRHDLAN